MSIKVAKGAPGWAAMVSKDSGDKGKSLSKLNTPNTHGSLIERYSRQYAKPTIKNDDNDIKGTSSKIVRQCMSCGLLYQSFHACS